MAEQSTEKEIVRTLKIGNKGWNIQLFENQNKLHPYVCGICELVCCAAVELGCAHSDDNIFLYCEQCLKELIAVNDGKCPINGHDNPIIIPNRSCRRQTSKLKVNCPYSVAYKSANNLSISHNDNGLIVNTPGYDDDIKEGVQQNQTQIPSDGACQWRGTLKELINNHIIECTTINNPNIAFKIKVNSLQCENKKLKNDVSKLQSEVKNTNKKNKTLSEYNETLKKRITNLQCELQKKEMEINKINKQNQKIHELNIKLKYELCVQSLDNKENETAVIQKKQQKTFSFAKPRWLENRKWLDKACEGYDIIDSNIIKYRSRFAWSGGWFLCMYGWFNKGDKVEIKFEFQSKGWASSHAFGFATHEWWWKDENHVQMPKHSAMITAKGKCELNDEFGAMNDGKDISSKVKSLNLLADSSIVVMGVDVSNGYGWIGNGEQSVGIVLPVGKITMVLGMSGMSEKIVKATRL
eukprot:355267_1